MQPPEPSPIIQEFLNYLSFQKRYSSHTVLSYQNDLTSFFEFIFTEYQLKEAKEITTPVIRTWLASLKENKMASKSINRKISTLRSFFKYQLRMKHVEVSPVATITSLKVSQRLPSFIAEDDMHTLLNNDYFEDTFQGHTEYLIIQVLYQLGLRCNELIQLKEKNIDFSSAVIKVLGKGNKERLLPVNNQLLKLIEEYMAEKRKEFNNELPFLLLNKKGSQISPRYVYDVVRKNLGKVSTNERKSPHILRHSFATHLTNNGAHINPVKELLGHSSLASTQIYTHNSIEKLKEVHKQAHPKS